MPDETLLNNGHTKKQTSILSFRDIEILPFEGQSVAQKTTSKPSTPINTGVTHNKPGERPARRTVSQPKGKLMTTNVGIKEIMNPTRKLKKGNVEDEIISDAADEFTFEQLEHAWKEYSLGLKRERKDKLYSTLVSSKLTMSSDYQINLEIVNSLQANDLDREKGAILGFLRQKLNNYSIGLKYSQVEVKKTQVLDNKGVFDKMVEDNSSLNKFRKLFNLDIEF